MKQWYVSCNNDEFLLRSVGHWLLLPLFPVEIFAFLEWVFNLTLQYGSKLIQWESRCQKWWFAGGGASLLVNFAFFRYFYRFYVFLSNSVCQ